MPTCRSLLFTTAVALSVVVGCAPTPAPVAPAPTPVAATPEQAQTLQSDLAKANTGAVVGHVVSVSGTLAAISFPSPAPKLDKGVSIQFQDASLVGIANGQVLSTDAVNPDYPIVVVEFEPTSSGRPPLKGDLAIYIPAGK